MSPPPSTPTPRRFLLPKRATQASQTPAVVPQFQSTPRFGSYSVPRPTRRKGLDVEDVEEPDWLSESDVEDDEGKGQQHLTQADSIDADSDGVSPSQQGMVTNLAIGDESREVDIISQDGLSMGSTDGMDLPSEERQAKRRKLSVSLSLSGSSPIDDGTDHVFADDQECTEHENEDEVSRHHGTTTNEDQANDPLNGGRGRRTPPQPIFRSAPRFKPVEEDTEMQGIPAAFSPQRRGVRYLPNGLAAELQGWLSEVKGWDGNENPLAASTLRIVVEEVMPGRRMYLVKVRQIDTRGSRKFMLAGEGRLTGLNKGAQLEEGSVIVIGQPLWDIELGGDVWTVACDWSVEK